MSHDNYFQWTYEAEVGPIEIAAAPEPPSIDSWNVELYYPEYEEEQPQYDLGDVDVSVSDALEWIFDEQIAAEEEIALLIIEEFVDVEVPPAVSSVDQWDPHAQDQYLEEDDWTFLHAALLSDWEPTEIIPVVDFVEIQDQEYPLEYLDFEWPDFNQVLQSEWEPTAVGAQPAIPFEFADQEYPVEYLELENLNYLYEALAFEVLQEGYGFVAGIKDVWTIPAGGKLWTIPGGGKLWIIPGGGKIWTIPGGEQ